MRVMNGRCFKCHTLYRNRRVVLVSRSPLLLILSACGCSYDKVLNHAIINDVGKINICYSYFYYNNISGSNYYAITLRSSGRTLLLWWIYWPWFGSGGVIRLLPRRSTVNYDAVRATPKIIGKTVDNWNTDQEEWSWFSCTHVLFISDMYIK